MERGDLDAFDVPGVGQGACSLREAKEICFHRTEFGWCGRHSVRSALSPTLASLRRGPTAKLKGVAAGSWFQVPG